MYLERHKFNRETNLDFIRAVDEVYVFTSSSQCTDNRERIAMDKIKEIVR